jgi:hypothetical protein
MDLRIEYSDFRVGGCRDEKYKSQHGFLCVSHNGACTAFCVSDGTAFC